MAAETDTLKFKIDDVEYALPPIAEFDMDEWEIVYDYSQLLFSDFAPLATFDEETGELIEGDEKEELARRRKTQQPAFRKALLHIAYRRAHPDAGLEEIKDIVRRARQSDFIEALYDASEPDVEGDARPPELTPKPDESSPRTNDDSSDSGSDGSTKSSGEAAAQPVPTGMAG